MIKSPIDRFWSKVQKTETCWLWQGTKDRKRYGHFKYNNKMVKAHRFSWLIARGTVPRELTHDCGVNNCVRLEHLSVTPETNQLKDFWLKVQKTEACWFWLGAKDRDGYGFFSMNKKISRAHRFSYEIHNESIPKGMIVCHHCDQPACVRPSHLFVGTQKDNMRDAIQKNRHASKFCKMPSRGEENCKAKLNNKKIVYIKQQIEIGKSAQSIAEEVSVSCSTIYRIKKGKLWRHIQYPEQS